jgi:hypothetical protein
MDEGCGDTDPSMFLPNDDILCTSEEDDALSAAGVYQYDGDTDDEADSSVCKKQKMF